MMTVEGMDVVDRLIKRIQNRLPITINFLVRNITDDMYNVAKRTVGKDTGALDKSIHKNIIESSMTRVEIDVVAGDPNVLRGEYSEKQGRRQKPIPTSEYAAAHEAWQKRDGRGYMGEAFEEAKENIKDKIKQSFNQVFGV